MSFIPGANLALDPVTMAPKRDKKGRYVWNMPQPVDEVHYLQIVKELVPDDEGRAKIVRVKKPVAFPVYRGVEMKFARWMRAQIKRNARKMEEVRLAAEVEAKEELKFDL